MMVHPLGLLLGQHLLLSVLLRCQDLLLDGVVKLLVLEVHHSVGPTKVMGSVHNLLLKVVLRGEHLPRGHHGHLMVGLNLAT